ncbi:MAG: RNA polymerase sigma factor RpoD/SigA [Fibromonadaceae bacterium]|jgi:RNA polymerase primary sigma factor|nr:RNA polymerase sigma factor RpoD/SigA [Fibromonadaceae bacterium]
MTLKIVKEAKPKIKRNVYFQYLNEISRIPLLTRDEETYLLQKVSNGDKAALNHLVKANLRFVIRVANLYKGQGLDLNDLINEGNLGLMEAAVRWDPSKNLKFISYAVWWVRQNIIKAINEKARLVRISAEKELILRRFNRKGGKLKQVVGGTQVVDPQSLAGYSKYNEEEIEKILQMGAKSSSLDAPVGEDGDTSLISITPDVADDAASIFLQKSRKTLIKKLLSEYLTPTELKVINLSYGFSFGAKNNLQDIAQSTGLTKEKVRQYRESAMAKLRTAKDLKEILNS